MKKIFSIILTAASLTLMTSCDDFLDITPEGQVKRDELLETNDGVEDALYCAYAQMLQSSL